MLTRAVGAWLLVGIFALGTASHAYLEFDLHAGRRNRTHTIAPSPPKQTSMIDAPGRQSIRLNAV